MHEMPSEGDGKSWHGVIADSEPGGSVECINQGRTWPSVYIFEGNVCLSKKKKWSKIKTCDRLHWWLLSQGRTQNRGSAKGDDAFPPLWVESGEAEKGFGDSSHDDVFTSNSSEVYRQQL